MQKSESTREFVKDFYGKADWAAASIKSIYYLLGEMTNVFCGVGGGTTKILFRFLRCLAVVIFDEFSCTL